RDGRRAGAGRLCDLPGAIPGRAVRQVPPGRADVVVVPSRDEVAPRVISEAQVRGLTVVASAGGGIPEQIEHDVAGRLFAARDRRGAGGAAARTAPASARTRAPSAPSAASARTARASGPSWTATPLPP